MNTNKDIGWELHVLRRRTEWSWERMCREFHRVQQSEGPSHTTLFRYGTGSVGKPNVLTERWVREALVKIREEEKKK